MRERILGCRKSREDRGAIKVRKRKEKGLLGEVILA
jgi:hypothetical protein